MPCLFTSHMDRWMDEKAYIREQTCIYGLDTVLSSRIWNITVHHITFRRNWPCMEKQVHLFSVKAALFWTGSKNRQITGCTTAQGTGRYCSRLLLTGAHQLVPPSSNHVLWIKSNQIFIRWVKLHRTVHLLTPFFFAICSLRSSFKNKIFSIYFPNLPPIFTINETSLPDLQCRYLHFKNVTTIRFPYLLHGLSVTFPVTLYSGLLVFLI